MPHEVAIIIGPDPWHVRFKRRLRWVFFGDMGKDAIIIDWNRALSQEVFVHSGHKVTFKGRIHDIMSQKSVDGPAQVRLTLVESSDAERHYVAAHSD